MTYEKWKKIIDMVNENFKIFDKGEEELELGKIEWIEFDSPLGKLRLELLEKPKIIDKKTLYTTRIGSDVKVEYVYSKDEKIYEFSAFRWDDESEEWLEIDAEDLNF